MRDPTRSAPSLARRFKSVCGLLALIALLGGCSSGGGTSTSASAQTSASTRLVALTVTPINGTVTVHTPLQMKAAGTFTDSTTQDLSSLVTWSSSSPAVTISASGVATGAHQGTATVTATLGDVSGSTALAVGPPPAFSGSWIERGPKPMYTANQLAGNVSDRLTAALPMGLTTRLIGTASGGVWRTTDSGATWRKLFDVNTGSTLGGGKDINLVVQSGYNQAISVDLYTSITIYIAGIEMCRVDGINIPNASYTSATRLTEGFWDAFGTITGGLAGSPHPDHHALVFDASANLLRCSDGGLYSLPNASVVGNFPSAVWTDLNGSDTTGFHNLACLQMDGISLDPTNTFAWAGFQDNGNGFSNGSLRWVMPSSGDGGIPLIEPTDPNRQWLVYNAQPPL
ncbi:MAG: hypothetical protein EB084_22465, partial [Proteobacteria bacterium]|nr:hypothetical protein [Pseudomonadota bacterium]